jgi:hypothetical protein
VTVLGSTAACCTSYELNNFWEFFSTDDFDNSNSKDKGHPMTCRCRYRGKCKIKLQPIRNLGTRRGWVVSTTHRSLCPRERNPVPTVQKAGWTLRPVWKGAENLAPSGIRSPDRPACCESPSRPPSWSSARSSKLRRFIRALSQQHVVQCATLLFLLFWSLYGHCY